MSNRVEASSFSYRLRRLRSLCTLDGFATSSLWTQGLFVLILGLVVVFGFSPFLGSVKLSAQMFMKTAGVEELETWPQIIFGPVVFCLGLLVFSLVITILTSGLNQFIARVKEGTLPFKRSNHIVIINANDMLLEVLSEINDRAAHTKQVYRVVVLVADSEAVDRVWKRLPQKPLLNIEIFVRQGNLHSSETFKRINLCGALGALFLHDYEKEDAFSRDSDTIKSLLALVGWPEFITAVHDRQKARNPFKFVAESSGTVGCERIIRETGLVDGFRPFLGANPLEVADHLLGRAIADSRFYDIFQDIFSFDGHEIYFLDPGKLGLELAGKPFRDLAYGFTRGIVIGRSRFEHGDFDIRLGPTDEV